MFSTNRDYAKESEMRKRAKVDCVNRANKEAARLYEELLPIFKPLVGCKIKKKDGTLLESVKKLLPEFPNEPFYSIRRDGMEYSLAFVVNVGKSCGEYQHVSHSVTVYIGTIREQVLTELSKPCERRTDWTYDELIAKEKDRDEKHQAYQDAESALYPFNERW